MTTKQAKRPRPRRSKSDERCIAFAKICRNLKVNPCDLADLCALVRQAAAAGERVCNIPNQSSDAQTGRVERLAAEMGWETGWNGLYPDFKASDGTTIQVPA